MRMDLMQQKRELEMLEDLYASLQVDIRQLEGETCDGQPRNEFEIGFLRGRLKQSRQMARMLYRRVYGRRRTLRRALCK